MAEARKSAETRKRISYVPPKLVPHVPYKIEPFNHIQSFYTMLFFTPYYHIFIGFVNSKIIYDTFSNIDMIIEDGTFFTIHTVFAHVLLPP